MAWDAEDGRMIWRWDWFEKDIVFDWENDGLRGPVCLLSRSSLFTIPCASCSLVVSIAGASAVAETDVEELRSQLGSCGR